MNSIVGVITRPDLQERALTVKAPFVPEAFRTSEEHLKAQFAAAASRIFGAILDGMSAALRASKRTHGGSRMIDFQVWAEAVVAHHGLGDFSYLYHENRLQANAFALEADAVAGAIILLMEETDE